MNAYRCSRMISMVTMNLMGDRGDRSPRGAQATSPASVPKPDLLLQLTMILNDAMGVLHHHHPPASPPPPNGLITIMIIDTVVVDDRSNQQLKSSLYTSDVTPFPKSALVCEFNMLQKPHNKTTAVRLVHCTSQITLDTDNIILQ
ncbi:hypothetical protein LSTR_LSTR004092 [Laodelphax striatellus]|uniref:Uncharacterized protein n=1 Tax=Laodelphax striatellus TaxID=195883 RepID=A0A482WGP4_LAOST|nr:hypothetical protein LSTR_LSTR004092 [Laodelphax striatellus]